LFPYPPLFRSVVIAAALARLRRRGLRGVAVEPARHVEVVSLPAPDHPREGLALHEPRVGVADRLLDDVVERVRFVAPVLDERVEAGEWRGMLRAAQPQPDAPRPAGRDGPAAVNRGPGATGPRVHGTALAAGDEVVDPGL